MAALPEALFLKPRDGSASLNAHACQRESLGRMLHWFRTPSSRNVWSDRRSASTLCSTSRGGRCISSPGCGSGPWVANPSKGSRWIAPAWMHGSNRCWKPAPAWLLSLRRGETLEPRIGQYQRGLYMPRYYTEVFMENLPWPPTISAPVPPGPPIRKASAGTRPGAGRQTASALPFH